jgi:hypothetical protein
MSVSFPRIESVEPLPGKRLRTTFADGTTKVYDCSHLLESAPFRPLEDEVLFRCVKVDPHGYGISWNDRIDLAESELWLHGVEESAAEHRI